MSQDDPENVDDKDGKSGRNRLAYKIAEQAGRLAALAMKDAPTGARILIFILYGIFGGCFFSLAIPPYDVIKQLFVLTFLIVSFIVLYIMMTRYHKDVDSRPALRNAEQEPELREGAKISGLSLADYDDVLTVLKEARKKVFQCVNEKQGGVSLAEFRANIFLPEINEDDIKYVLRIYPGLHVNMENGREREICFGPGEGLTGRVFEEGVPRVAERITSESTGWDSVYTLTDEQLSRIHPKLQWILSVPLKDGETSVGVLNIDGLQDDAHVDVIYECMHNILAEIATMQALLSRKT